MIYFFRRGTEALSCETRLDPAGNGYELLVTEHGRQRCEVFASVADMLSREHELLQAWRAQGWREVGGLRQPPAARSPKVRTPADLKLMDPGP